MARDKRPALQAKCGALGLGGERLGCLNREPTFRNKQDTNLVFHPQAEGFLPGGDQVILAPVSFRGVANSVSALGKGWFGEWGKKSRR